MTKIFLFLFLISINHTYAQKVNKNTGSKISLNDAQEILDHHNQVRKKVGTSPLLWSINLSAYAQAWANHLAKSKNCTIKHRTISGEDGNRYGENTFWGSSSQIYKAIDASFLWYKEKKMYRYQKLGNNNWYRTGHYTQMIWRDTKLMGVGVARCRGGGLIVVANYFPAGNMLGQYPY